MRYGNPSIEKGLEELEKKTAIRLLFYLCSHIIVRQLLVQLLMLLQIQCKNGDGYLL